MHNLQVQLENHVFILDEIVEKACHDNSEDSGNKEISSSIIPADPEAWPPPCQDKS